MSLNFPSAGLEFFTVWKTFEETLGFSSLCSTPPSIDTSFDPSINQTNNKQTTTTTTTKTMHHETPEDSAVSGDAPDFFHVPGIQIKSNGHKCNHLNNQTPFDIKNDPRYSNAPARCVQQAVLFVVLLLCVVVVVVVCFVVLLLF